MAGSTYSTNLKIELMTTGENAGTWGNVTNTNLGTTLEQAVVGLSTVDFPSDANLTITLTNSNESQAARSLVLNVTSVFGSLSATRELIVPTIQKQYIVQNNTAGGQSITVKTSAGTGITVPNGRKAQLYVDGTNVIMMADFVDINGGAIDGTPVGASSASTGAFTTLSSSSTTTLNGTTVPASSTLVTTAAIQTLERKTIDVGDIASGDNVIGGFNTGTTCFVAFDGGTGQISTGASTKAVPGGVVVGTTDVQTLTNKTLNLDTGEFGDGENVISGIAASSFVLSNGSGNIDGAAAQKAIPSGVVVGTTDSQTLTNKTISVDDNTVSGIAASSFVLSNGSGNIDGSAAQKAIPTGDVVGTTDSQTLTNKTIESSTASLTTLTVDNITLNGFTLSTTGGGLAISADGGAAGVSFNSTGISLTAAAPTGSNSPGVIQYNNGTNSYTGTFGSPGSATPLEFVQSGAGQNVTVNSLTTTTVGGSAISATGAVNATYLAPVFGLTTTATEGDGVITGTIRSRVSGQSGYLSQIRMYQQGSTAFVPGGQMRFGTTSDGSSTTVDRFYIHNNGALSVGFNSSTVYAAGMPALNVGSATGATISVWYDTEESLRLRSTNAEAFIESPTAGTDVVLNTNAADIVFDTSTTERMRIDDTTGYVGVGVVTPAAMLDVGGQISGKFIDNGLNTLAQDLGTNHVAQVTISAAVTLTTTVPPAGTQAILIIVTSGVTTRTVTFGTGFKSSATLATGTVANRRFVLSWVSDGTNLIECSRTVAITY